MSEPFRVRPVAGTRGLVVLTSALALVLAGPTILDAIAPPDAELAYSTLPARFNGYRWMAHELAEDEDIDILIVGASSAKTAIDPRRLEPRRVLNFSFDWRGAESNYEVVRQTVSRRKVGLVLWVETFETIEKPHPLAPYWWSGVESGRDQLTWPQIAGLHGARVVGTSRRLWSLGYGRGLEVHPTHLSAMTAKAAASGYEPEDHGWKSHYDDEPQRPFVRIAKPTIPTIEAADMIFDGRFEGFFRRSDRPYSWYQSLFLEQLFELCAFHDTAFATLWLPVGLFEAGPREVVRLRPLARRERRWPTIGVPQAALFEDPKRYYANENHLNSNGAQVMTTVIAPAIDALLERARHANH